MQLSEEEVKKIGILARLGLTEEEVKLFSTQLTDILNFVEILNEIDTENVEPTSQVTGLENVMEEDEVVDYVDDKNKLLACTNLPVEARQILVKSVFNG